MQENFELRIREIAKLKKGWSFGKGEPFNAEHVEVAALHSSALHLHWRPNET